MSKCWEIFMENNGKTYETAVYLAPKRNLFNESFLLTRILPRDEVANNQNGNKLCPFPLKRFLECYILVDYNIALPLQGRHTSNGKIKPLCSIYSLEVHVYRSNNVCMESLKTKLPRI